MLVVGNRRNDLKISATASYAYAIITETGRSLGKWYVNKAFVAYEQRSGRSKAAGGYVAKDFTYKLFFEDVFQ